MTHNISFNDTSGGGLERADRDTNDDTVKDGPLVELTEAFAAQAIACERGLDLDPARVNVHGGALALGHPVGASGARLVVTLAHAMQARRTKVGLATLCIGLGQGMAVLFEEA